MKVIQLLYLTCWFPGFGADVNLIEEIHHNVTASMSSTWCPNRTFCLSASNAVDLNDNQNPFKCACCAGASRKPSWWKLDLGEVYSIQKIIFIGRNDSALKQSRNFAISAFVDGKDVLIYQNKASSGTRFEERLDPPVALQILTITHDTETLTFCELKLVEGDVCPVPYFDRHCNQTCNCFDKQPCNKTSGVCQSSGCEAGWKGDSCNAACVGASFGVNCSFDCHCHADDTCDPFHGNCSSGICASGWIGDNCSIPCNPGTFGQNCSFICHCKNNDSCNHISGDCYACAPGWQGQNCSAVCDWGSFGDRCSSYCYCYDNAGCNPFSGICSNGLCSTGYRNTSCNEECESGTFGQNCSSECHCDNKETCHHISGSCNVCAPGWQGTNCSIACDLGSFGYDCSQRCYCYQNAHCDSANGTCSNGQCEAGWHTHSCSQALLKENEPATSTAVIIGPVVGILIIAAVAAAVVLFRRHSRNINSEVPAKHFTDLHDPTPTSGEVKKTAVAATQSKTKDERAEKQEDHTYYSFSTKENTIQVQKLWDYISQAYETNFAKLHLEFKKLPPGLIHKSTEASRQENIRKNRYKGICAYDHTRVVLQRDDPSESTYVNACYIDGYSKPKKFIASQGPQENTSEDFCEMVYQKNISMIVMLTNAVELGTRKCVQYWPSGEDDELNFGAIEITTVTTTTYPDYTIRELDFSKAREKPHRITQVHFTAWPDKDVPDSAWHLVNVWRKVNSLIETITEPIVVHCSAGIGRTGTFIALDNLYAQARSEGYIQPLDAITKLRNQRVNMVQTKDQYVFVHEAVAEALYIGVKATKIQDFDSVYSSLLEKDKATGEIGLEQQFLFLQKVNAVERDDEYCNVHLAREHAYRPKATPSADANKYGFIFLQNYTGKDTFIVMKTVDSSTISQEILNVVRRNKVKTVISLSVGHGSSLSVGHGSSKQRIISKASRPVLFKVYVRHRWAEELTIRFSDRLDLKCGSYGNGEFPLIFNGKTVLMALDRILMKIADFGGNVGKGNPDQIVSKRQNSFLEKTIKLEQQKSKQGSRQVKQFEFLMWQNDARLPSAPNTVVELLNAVQRWQPATDENHPILVTCESGHEKSGLICALLSEFERIRVREEVNLLATVKAMKQTNPQFISNYEQYKFCHSAVLEYIRQSDVYMNVG